MFTVTSEPDEGLVGLDDLPQASVAIVRHTSNTRLNRMSMPPLPEASSARHVPDVPASSTLTDLRSGFGGPPSLQRRRKRCARSEAQSCGELERARTAGSERLPHAL